MLPLEHIKELILYVIDTGMDKNMSVSVNFYTDNVEVSAYPVEPKEKQNVS